MHIDSVVTLGNTGYQVLPFLSLDYNILFHICFTATELEMQMLWLKKKVMKASA